MSRDLRARHRDDRAELRVSVAHRRRCRRASKAKSKCWETESKCRAGLRGELAARCPAVRVNTRNALGKGYEQRGSYEVASTRRRSYSEAVDVSSTIVEVEGFVETVSTSKRSGRGFEDATTIREWHTGTRGFALFLKKLPHRVARIKSIGRVSVLGKTKKTRGGGSTTKKRIRPTSPGPSVAESSGSKKRRVDEPPRPLLRRPLDGASRLGLEQDDLDALDLDDESRGIIRVIREERAHIARRRALLHDMDLDLQKMEKAALAKGGIGFVRGAVDDD
ncbi:predicted protein [Postia placenta Mad-698-R]|nr:predicted protein [Postia placenta Mad-698-R]